MDRIQEKIKEALTESQKENRVILDQCINSLKNDIYNKIDTNQNNIMNDLNQKFDLVNNKIYNFDRETKAGFANNLKIIQEQAQNLKDFMYEHKINRRKDKDDITSYIFKVDTMTKDNLTNINLMLVWIHNISESIKRLFENEILNQVLSMKDEEDRHSIALWGVKNSQNSDKIKSKFNAEPIQLNEDVRYI